MLPAIATMVGLYIIFRMIETVFLSTSRYSRKFQHVFVGILAGIIGVIVFVEMIGVWLAGSNAGNIPRP